MAGSKSHCIYNTLAALIINSAIILWQRKQIEKLTYQVNEDKKVVEDVMKQVGSGRVVLELVKEKK